MASYRSPRLQTLLRQLLAGGLVLLLASVQAIRAEEVVENAEDGSVRVRYETDDAGRKHGRFESFHPNGKPARTCTYKVDQRDGLERTWDDDGTLRTAHTYKQGVLHGSHKTYAKTGRLEAQQAYKQGVLHGSSKSYHPNRRLHVVTRYRAGVLDGKYHARKPDGSTFIKAVYRKGRLHGTYVVMDGKTLITKQVWDDGTPNDIDGVVPFPRSQEALRGELARTLKGAGALPTKDLDADRELALRQLKAYRYLVGVPYADLGLDATYNAHAQAGSEICAAIGRITHTPPNPGWDSGRFDFAAKGTKSSNLHSGNRACTSVRGYMDDSDPTNIDRVGHRCWCVNPDMLKTGFGHEKGFTAMWAMDHGRTQIPDYTFVSLPPPGYVPGPWMGSHWAWSVWLNPSKFDAPTSKVQARVEPVGEDFLPTGPALALNYSTVKDKSTGIPYLVIFRAKAISLDAGRRYRVTLDGLTRKGKPQALRYFVEFFDLPYARPRLPKSR